MTTYEDDEDLLHFQLRLLVKHPRLDLSSLTKILSLTPNLVCTYGTRRVAPNGDPLPGRYHESIWQWSERVEGRRDFAKRVSEFVQQLQAHSETLLELVDEGAVITIVIDLSGGQNIGAVFAWPGLRNIADLKMNLSIEVFPIYD